LALFYVWIFGSRVDINRKGGDIFIKTPNTDNILTNKNYFLREFEKMR